MNELTSRATGVIEKVERFLASVQEQFSKAHMPDPDAHRYSAVENDERRRQKMEELARSVHIAFVDLLEQVRRAIKLEEQSVHVAVHPLEASNSTYDKEAARYEENYAHRIVEAVGFKKLEEEYKAAMKAEKIDLATSLIDWGERFAIGRQPEAAQVIANMKAAHVEALQLNSFLLSRDALLKKEKLLTERLQMLAGGFIVTEQAQSAEAFAAMLKAGGLAVDSVQLT